MLRLGIPNGSLFEATIKLLNKLGIYVQIDGRNFEANVSENILVAKVYIMRPQKIPIAVRRNVIDAGICGWDCVVESRLESKMETIERLYYGKRTNQPVKVVLFGKSEKFIDKANVVVSSEYPNIASDYFKKARIEFSQGSTEVDVVSGLADYGICVSESGDSLQANGLKVIKVLLESPTVLVAWKKFPEAIMLGKLLKGALLSERFQMVKMNVDSSIVDAVLKILPSLKSPTLNRLADKSYAIETMVEKIKVADLFTELSWIGATGIFTQDVNIVC
jgi:ATP phosphoribosyltransferase